MIPPWLSLIHPMERQFLLPLRLDSVLSRLDTLTDAGPWSAPYGITGPPLTVRTRKADPHTYVVRLAQTAQRRRQSFPHYDGLVECASVPEGTRVVLAIGREPQEVWFSALVLVILVPMMYSPGFLSLAVRSLLALAVIAAWWAYQRMLVYRMTRHLTQRLTAYLSDPTAG